MLKTDFCRKNSFNRLPFLGASPLQSCEMDSGRTAWMWTWIWTWTWTWKASVVPFVLFVLVHFYPAGINNLESNTKLRSNERVSQEQGGTKSCFFILNLLHVHHPQNKKKGFYSHFFSRTYSMLFNNLAYENNDDFMTLMSDFSLVEHVVLFTTSA